MKTIVYDNVTGQFIGYGNLSDFPTNVNYLEKEVADLYLTTVIWDSARRDFVNTEPTIQDILALEFLLRFTTEERIALENLSSTDLIIKDFFFLLTKADTINLQNPLIIAALNYFESLNIVTTDRKHIILGY